MWQNYVLAAVQWAFAVVLVPTILHKEHKPPLSTSVLTTALMAVIVVTYASLSFWASAIAAGILCLGWGTIAVQRYLLNRRAPLR